MTISSTDFDVFYGTTIVGGKAIPSGDWCYVAHKTYGFSATENLRITVSWEAGPNGQPGMEGVYITAYSVLANNDADSSNWMYLWYPNETASSPSGYVYGDGSVTFTVSAHLMSGAEALSMGETHVIIEGENCSITSVSYSVVAVQQPGVPVAIEQYPTYQDAGNINYDNYFPEVARVWDDVAVVAWTQYGDYPIRFRAVRHNPDMTVTLGPQVQDPIFSGSPGSSASLGDGAAVFTPGRYFDDFSTNYMGWVVKVDRDTLVCTIDPIVAPFRFFGDGWSQTSTGPNRVLFQVINRSFYSGTSDDQALCLVTWDGTNHTETFYTYQGIASATDQYNFTTLWLDFGTSYVRVNIAYNGTGTGDDMVQFYEHAVLSSGLPEAGLGTFKFEIGKSTGWQFDNVYGDVINDTQALIYQVSDGGYQSIWLLDISTWTLQWKGDMDQGQWGNYKHLDDWAGVVRTQDIANGALVAHTPWPDTAGATVAMFDGSYLVDAVQVYPWGPGYDTSINDHRVAYLSDGNFISVISANSLSSAVPWIGDAIWVVAGKFTTTAVTQLWINLSHDENAPNWVSVCPNGRMNIATSDPPVWTDIHLSTFKLNAGTVDAPDWRNACNH